ncbi:alpha/beta hydrolase [Lacticaseibacillus saniviri]
MAYLTLQYFAPQLQNQTTIRVLLPDQIDGPLQSLYLLHGLGDDGSGWQRKTAIETLVADKQVAVIMPALPRSWYRNQVGSAQFDYLTRSLPAYLEQLLPLATDTKSRFVIGNSMGGYGALQWLLAMPDYFSAAAVLSPVVDLAVVPDIMPDYRQVFADDKDLAQAQLPIEMAEWQPLKTVPIYWTIGNQDFLRSQNDQWYERLNPILNIDYQVTAGEHDWFFWNQAIIRALATLPLRQTKGAHA